MGQGARPPVTRKLPFLKSYRDRHGRERHYLRMKGCASVAIPGEHGSKAFMDAYWTARDTAQKREPDKAKEIRPRSFDALVVAYYKSKAYTELRPITKATYRNVIERFRAAHGDKMVSAVRQRHIVKILEDLPANAVTWRKVIRLLLNHALAADWITVHPMSGMRRPKRAKEGYRTWTEADIAAYCAKWRTGSRERLALALLLYTAQRRHDVVGMGRQHVRGDQIHVVQHKGGARLWIALHPQLQAEIAHVPAGQLGFVLTQYGEPFTPAGFGNWFGEKARDAGCADGCTAHGLRKAAARRLAEAGCTPHQIKAVTGHKNLAEVTLYTDAADQERLARQAIGMVEPGTNCPTTPGPVRQVTGNV